MTDDPIEQAVDRWLLHSERESYEHDKASLTALIRGCVEKADGRSPAFVANTKLIREQQARIVALEAQTELTSRQVEALEKADYLVEFLLDTTCYPLTYGGTVLKNIPYATLRTMVCNYNDARAKVVKP